MKYAHDIVVRFDVRDALNCRLHERRSEQQALAYAKAERRKAGGPISVVRVETEGRVVRERHVATFS